MIDIDYMHSVFMLWSKKKEEKLLQLWKINKDAGIHDVLCDINYHVNCKIDKNKLQHRLIGLAYQTKDNFTIYYIEGWS